ncbi:putative NADPH oxidoreductase [Gordonia araii NBRC 100433]|uniref:Putative NADPH oxidoreductase n=1 Tax=Gordonia araii NBRC 100433 TaxID=1073574 RepID=G7H618_9ACTN|nr:FAD-binding oxidoreductase [Gordonia araii]NNG96972.1 ferredoxin reductase [Gordonia araii NBRC 100433]GAB11340.1 putative NADPH oxidoreductase [Gordonia araii NBRC 100433]
MSTRLSNFMGSVVQAALAPHPVDRYLELVDPMITWRDLRAQVIDVRRATDRTVTLTLRPTRQWKGHKSGQFVQLSTVINGVRHMRCFSPANAAGGRNDDIELTITAHDDGFVSRHLREHARPGMVVGLDQAAGDFTLPENPGGSMVFISGGSGITPVLSMLRTLVAQNYQGAMTFVHYARSADDVAYASELSNLAALYPNLDLRLHYTRGASPDHFTGEHVADVTTGDTQIFVCGPASLMTAVREHCEAAGLGDRLHSEAFSLATAPVIDPNEPTTGELSFTSSGITAANDGRTILDQAEAAGLSPESGCRMGICFSCTKVKKSGCTRNILTGETDSEADKHIQLCVNTPVGDVEIEV